MNLLTSPLLALITALSLIPLQLPAIGILPEEPPAVVSEYGVPLPESEPVADEWFDDAAFIGHSLIYGFSSYSGLRNADCYSLPGSSVKSLLKSNEVNLPGGKTGSLKNELGKHSYNKVYLMMGLNEVAGKMSQLHEDYVGLINLVRSYHPDAEIYVLAVLPVSQRKASGGVYTLERIVAYNNMLMEVCAQQSCWYVDLYTPFADENGYLPSAAASDGVHLNSKQYIIMLDYLRTHTARN